MTVSECLVCTAKTELFLCPSHIGELRANLTKLAQGAYIPTSNGRTASGGNWHIERRTAGLLDALADVVLKRTRLGGGGSGHRKRGDEMPGPFEPDTERGRRTAQGQADYLLDAARNTLTTIFRDLCETRGAGDVMTAFAVVRADFIGPLETGWRRVTADWRPSLWRGGNVAGSARPHHRLR
jgi:hypothetical protein